MVAIVSGNSLGLNLTSNGVLGAAGLYGDPKMGQGGEQVYVNASTGNLVMQQLQDQLVGSGLNVSSVLTYNSQGLLNDDNGDNFSIGKAPAQLALAGTRNTSGSTLTRTAFDGSQAVYTWDSVNSRYVAVNGTGAFDTITFSGSACTWTDGATQQKETYDGISGNLLTRTDAAGNTITFGYTGGLLTSVTDANGETATYVYSGTQLTQIKAPTSNGVQPVVSYFYDGSNRLSSVVVDLTPDGSTADGKTYTTGFTYDGTSSRVHTVSQSDGTNLTFAYDGSNRVFTITDGLGGVTTFNYDSVNLKTSVTANGQTTAYAYNAAGQLLSVTAPAVNGVTPVTQFTYAASGELASTTDADGRTASMGYDAAGNQVSVLDGAGNLTSRAYDGQNRLISETASMAPTPALVATGMAASGGNVAKTGTTAAWDSSVRSASSITGAATVSFTATSAATNLMVGLNSDPDTSVDYSSLDYALYLNSGTLAVFINGAWGPSAIGTYAAGDRLGVSYDGNGHVNFLKNGQILYSLASTVTQPLFVDSTFYQPGSGVANLTYAAGTGATSSLVATPGMTVSGNDVVKSSSSSNWDGAVRSVSGFSGAVTTSFTATSTSTYLMVGLNSDPDQDASYTSLDYALYLETGNLRVFASGNVAATSIGSYAVGDRLSVSYDGSGHVDFFKNGQLLYALAATPTQPLYLDTSFCTAGASVGNLTFGQGTPVDQTLLNTAGMSISGNSATKAAGTAAWDSGFRSAGSFVGAGSVSFTATSAGTNLMVGLNSDPDTDAGYASIDYALYLEAGNLRVFGSGTSLVSSIGSYVQGDRLGVSYDGHGNVSFLKNGQVLYTLAATPARALYVDSSFYQAGSSVAGLTFATDALDTSSFVNTAGTAISAGTVTKTASTAAWDAGARSAVGITGAATVSFTATGSNAALMVGLNSDPDTDASYASIDYALYLDNGGLKVYSNGAFIAGTLTAYSAGDRLGVSYDGNGHVSFLRNGQAIYSMAASPSQPLYADSSFYDSNSSVANLSFGPGAALVSTAGMSISGNGAIKTATTTNWDSGFRSASAISGAATVSFTATASNTALMVGLNSDPDTDASYASIDYALYLSNGNLDVYSNGAFIAGPLSTYSAGDRLAVSYDGHGHVNFLKNGQVVYSMAGSPSQPLYADSSFYDPNSSVANVSFTASTPDLTTRYVYSADGRGLLRFKVTPEGRVTEYGYDAQGQLTSTNEYTNAVYSTAGMSAGDVPTEAMMVSWRASQNLAQTQRTDIARDSRQQVSSVSTYAATAADGTGAAGSASSTTFVYDPSGRLLQTIKPGAATSTYVYDGLGRLTSTTDPLNRTTTTAYADASGTIAVTSANQLVTTSAYDKNGRLTSTTRTYAGATLARNTVDYDSLGNVLRATDATGVSTWYLYDADGRQVAAIDGNGALTEYVLDNAGQVIETIGYATPINTALLVDGNGKPDNPALASVRPSSNPATDHRHWTVYDASGRVSQTIGSTGTVTQVDYDSASRVTCTRVFATAVDVSTLGSAAAFQFVAPSTADRVTRSFYDGDDRLVGTLDPDHYLTSYQYDAAGQQTATIRYATQSPAATTPLTLAQLTPAASSGDQRTLSLYDEEGRLTGQIDALGTLTQTFYNPRGTVDHVTRYATSVGNAVAAGTLVDAIRPASTSSDTTTSYVYDADDRLTSSTDAAGSVTSDAYDANTDELLSSTTDSGRADAATTQTRYDAMGRGVATLDGVSSALITAGMTPSQVDAVWAQHAQTTTYDLAGRRTGTKDALGNTTLYFYDGDGQLRYTVDPLNAVKEFRYDAFGNVCTTIAYATPINPAGIGSGGLVTSGLTSAVAAVANVASDSASRSVFDAAGRVTLSVDPTGAATGYTYDASGNLTQTRQYATPLPPGTIGTGAQLQALVTAGVDATRDRIVTNEYDADGQLVYSVDALGHATRLVYDTLGNVAYKIGPDGSLTCNQYDADGELVKTTTFATLFSAPALSGLAHALSVGQAAALVPASSASDAIAQNRYDSLGRLRFMMDGTGGLTELRYDADGNVADRIGYANKATWNAGADPTVAADTTRDLHVHSSYDALGRVLAQSDGTGAVVVNTYDADGNLTDRVSYANRIAPGSWTSSSQPTVTADSARDIHERLVYNALGQLAYSADGTGAVTAYTYDAGGNLTRKTLLATAAAPGQALNSVSTSGADRTERFCYDALGQQVWHADATGALTYTGYDADGNLTTTIQYAQPLSGAMPAGATPLATTAADRVTQVAYNAFGQVTYTVDAINRVSLDTYDLAGRLLSTTRYAATIAAGAAPSTVTVNAALDQTTSYLYDAAGRLAQRTDAMGGVQSYTYDGLGNKLTMTDEKGQVWTTTYDAAGRELTQTSPVVSITANAVNGSGDLAATSIDAGIVTAMTYDGVGNLTQRIDAYGRPEARTTTYTYDAAGRQATVQGPAFSSYNYQGTLVSSSAPVSTTFHDAFGNVVATIDPMGAIKYATYDQANRLRFSVDPLGCVTGDARDTFGDVLVQTTYGAQTTLVGAAPTSAANAPTTSSVSSTVAALAHATDRVTTYTVDNLGRVKSTSGMSGYFVDATAGFNSNAAESAATPTTSIQYDAFGDLVSTSQLVNQGQGLYASTYHYFDAAGQETDTVDASGYQTHRTFDSFGNVTQTLEYATAKTGAWSVGSLGTTPVTSGLDRTTTDVFDRLDRKTSETRNVAYSLTDDGTVSGQSLTTSWGYDAQGHVTRITDPAGAVTYHSYDALGRMRSVIAPSRSSTADGSTITPLTEYGYDAFGETTLLAQRFNTATSVTEFTGVWTSAGAKGYSNAASASDRITSTLYDNGGHAIQVDDPMAATTSFHNTWSYYDANGRLAYTKHQVNASGADTTGYKVDQGYQYDAAGQMTLSSHSVGTAAAPREATSQRRYDAFGEVVAKGVDNGWQEFFDYDNNGNLWLTNTGTGVVTAYAYDLQGHQTVQYTSQGIGHNNVDLSGSASIQSVVAAQVVGLRVVNTVHDFVGNVRRTDEASRSAVDAGVTVRVGATTWSITHSGSTGVPNTLTLGFNSLLALGNGQVQFTINYVATDGTASVATIVADSAQAASSYVASWTPASHPGITSVTSVIISKKDTDGIWRTVNTSTVSNVSHTQLEIDAPDDAGSVVTFTYTKSGGSPVTLTSTSGLTNYGSEYSFDTSALAAGTYSYSSTITSADGTVSAPRAGSFTVGTSQSPSTVTTQITPSIFKTFDRWGNLLSVTDPRSASWITSYQYNGNNQLVVETQPVPLAGSAAPVTRYFYDRQGNRVAQIDADGHLRGQLFDLAGQLVETDAHPDGATLVKTTNAFDVFGDIVQSIAGDGYTASGAAAANVAAYTTVNTYDLLGHLTSVQHGIGGTGNVYDGAPGGPAWVNERQAYTYDADGHRLSSWDDTTATHSVTTYTYDAAGNLNSTTLPLVAGRSTASTTTYVYDDFGHESSETDADGNTETWTDDYFGHVTAHKDLGTTTYTYHYDSAGQLYQQGSSAGQNLSYSFDAAGQLTGIADSALNETTTYAYDAAGNHLLESVSVAGTYYQDNHLAYDALGRLMDSSDGEVHVGFQYDAVGNRTLITTHVLESGGLLAQGSVSQPDSTRNFTYDGMNRQLHVNWQSTTLSGQQGHTLTYDADSNRLSDVFMNNLVTVTGTPTTSGTGPDGAPIYASFTGQSYAATNGLVKEVYTYDSDDRLAQTLYTLKNGSTSGWINIDSRMYDTAGRMVTKGASLPGLAVSGNSATLLQWFNSINPVTGLVGLHLDSGRVTGFSYDADGELVTINAGPIDTGFSSTTYTYDAAGNESGNTLFTQYRDAGGYKHTQTIADTDTITPAEGYETTIISSNQSTTRENVDGTTTAPPATVVTSTTKFDVNGHVTEVDNATLQTTTNVSDEQGNVLRQSSTGSELRNLVVNGESLGQYGIDTSVYAAGDVQRFTFTFGFTSMEDSMLRTGTSVVTAGQDETLEQLATAAYGDSHLWQRVAAINGLDPRQVLHEGQRVVIAGSSGEMFNSASTFASSNSTQMISSTRPRTVVSDPVMTEVEKDDYYKDVYNTVGPSFSGNSRQTVLDQTITLSNGLHMTNDGKWEFRDTDPDQEMEDIAADFQGFGDEGHDYATDSRSLLSVIPSMYSLGGGGVDLSRYSGGDQPPTSGAYSLVSGPVDLNGFSGLGSGGSGLGNAVGSSLASAENSPGYGGQPAGAVFNWDDADLGPHGQTFSEAVAQANAANPAGSPEPFPYGAVRGGTTVAGSLAQSITLSSVGLHEGGDGWDTVQPMWNDASGNPVMPQVGVSVVGSLRPVIGPAAQYPNLNQLPEGGSASALVDQAGHLYFHVTAPDGTDTVVTAPQLGAQPAPEVQRVEITGKRMTLAETLDSEIWDTGKDMAQGAANLGYDLYQRSSWGAKSRDPGMPIPPARSGFFQQAEQIGLPGAIVVGGINMSVFGPMQTIGGAAGAVGDTGYGLATGNNGQAARGMVQLSVLAGSALLAPAASRLFGAGAVGLDGTMALQSRGTGMLTGVSSFDQLFVDSPQASKMLDALGRRGVNVVNDASRLDLGASAQVFRENGQLTLVYDSQGTSFVDMLHEARHVAQVQRVDEAGVLGNKDLFNSPRLLGAAERGAYEYETRLGNANGFSSDYMSYLQSQIDYYYPPGYSTKFSASPTMGAIFNALEPGLKP